MKTTNAKIDLAALITLPFASGVGWFFHSFTIGLLSFAALYFLIKLILDIGALRFILAMIGIDILFGGD